MPIGFTRMVLLFWCRLTQVLLEKRPFNECSVVVLGTADNIKRLLKNSIGNWKTELNAYGTMTGEVNIWRGIFHGDSLSMLLFVIAIIPLTRTLRQCDTGYQLGDGHSNNNHLLFMYNLELYGRNDRKIESLVHIMWMLSEDSAMQNGWQNHLTNNCLDKHNKSQSKHKELGSANNRAAKERDWRFSNGSWRSSTMKYAIKVKIDKQEGEAMCRICKKREETVRHIISECSKLAQL